MSFPTLLFGLFFLCFCFLYFIVSSNRRVRLYILTAASILFYGTWNWRFTPLLLGTGVIDFYIAQAIADYEAKKDRRTARRLLTVSIVLNLGVLAVFKYNNFALSTVEQIARVLGVHFSAPVIHLIVPLGISFYTFQSMSYTIDVYMGTFKPKRDLLDFLASLTFFPHLLAGPIVRSSYLLPQFETLTAPDRAMTTRGFLLIGLGLFKKTIADQLAPVVDSIFTAASSGPVDAVRAWTGTLGFMAQVYGDFSGYCDMGIGIAALLGFSLPQNFNLPFISASPSEFWQRWHISLSLWFRDYVYYPLAFGWFKGKPYLNTVFVLILAGVWHGPQWNYFLHGVLFGFGVGTINWIARKWPRLGKMTEAGPGRIVAIAATFCFIATMQTIFRSPTWASAWHIFQGELVPVVHSAHPRESWLILGLVVAALVSGHLFDYLLVQRRGGVRRPLVVWVAVGLAFYTAIVFGPSGQAFIYFQF